MGVLGKIFGRRTNSSSYTKSSHRRDYEEIAAEYGVDPQYVYDIAHGLRPARGESDRIILTELYDKGVID